MAKRISREKSFKRMIETPLGTRVYLPHFGSRIHELIDKTMNQKWVLLFQKYLYECFFDENWEPWDDRLIPDGVTITSYDEKEAAITCEIKFQDGTVLSYGVGSEK